MAFRFTYRWAPRFQLLPLLMAVLMLTVTVALGEWQLRRAHEKIDRATRLVELEQLAPLGIGIEEVGLDDVVGHRVIVQGNYIDEATVLLDNRPHANGRDSRAGFIVITPLRIKGPEPRYVLIKRGWLVRDQKQRVRIPYFATPSGNVEIEGIAQTHAGRVFEFRKKDGGETRDGMTDGGQTLSIKQNIEIAEIGRQYGWPMQPFVVEQRSMVDDGLARDWPHPASGAERHYGYAFQWFALAGLTLVLTLFFSLMQRRPSEADAQ